MLRTYLLAAFASFMVTGPAMALSCMTPDPVVLYENIRDDDARFYLLRGTLSLSEPFNAPLSTDTGSSASTTKATATGMALSNSGFSAPFEREVILRTTCFTIWCGGLGTLEDRLQFIALRIEDDETLVLERGPCGGNAIDWSPEDETRVLNCHRNGVCERKGFR